MEPNRGARPESAPQSDQEEIREAFYRCAELFEAIHKEWLLGDEQMIAWLRVGMQASQSGFATIMREQERAGVYISRQLLKSSLLPFLLPHADPSLRDRIQRVMRLTDPEGLAVDATGNKTERWRLTWPATGLEEELDELLPMLRAAGDAALLAEPRKQQGGGGHLDPEVKEDLVQVLAALREGRAATLLRDDEQQRDKEHGLDMPVPSLQLRQKVVGAEVTPQDKLADDRYLPASAFPKSMRGRLRHATRPGRKRKFVRSKTVDEEKLYYEPDVKRHWPSEYPGP